MAYQQRGNFRPQNREMHNTTCADCGQSCEVPFKPDGSRPVYCRDCYQSHKPQGRSYQQRGGFRSQQREMHSATCASCGQDCEVPFKPDGDKPVYCKDCYQKNKTEGDTTETEESQSDAETESDTTETEESQSDAEVDETESNKEEA